MFRRHRLNFAFFFWVTRHALEQRQCGEKLKCLLLSHCAISPFLFTSFSSFFFPHTSSLLRLFFLRGVIPAWCNKISIHWKTQWQILLAATPKSIAILLYYDIWKIVTEIVIKQILQKARQSDRRNSYPPFFSDHTLWKSMITWITRSRCPVEQSIDRVPQQMTRDIICYDSVSVITCRTA